MCLPPWFVNQSGVCDLDFCAAGGGVITPEGTCVYTVQPSSPPAGPSTPHNPVGPQINVGNIPQAGQNTGILVEPEVHRHVERVAPPGM